MLGSRSRTIAREPRKAWRSVKESPMKSVLFLALALAIAGEGAAQPRDRDAGATPRRVDMPLGRLDGVLAAGEVRRADPHAGMLTVRHEPIPTLNMPAMTMVYRVDDAARLDQLKSGDRLWFEVNQVGGAPAPSRIAVVR